MRRMASGAELAYGFCAQNFKHVRACTKDESDEAKLPQV